jgi:threonine dehydratase
VTDPRLPDLAGIEAAARAIAPHMAPTPLIRSEILSRVFKGEVWLKNETTTPIASFKLRGALASLIRARERDGIASAVTSSTGNHGQGVAYAGRLLGIPADIFLPAESNPVKAAMIEAFGGRLHKIGADLDEAKDAAKAHAAASGGYFVDDGDDPDLMEGAGTCGLEIARALQGIDAVFVPLGGGNFVSGLATAIKGVQPDARAIAVQAKGSPAMVESFHAKRPVERPCDTIADGLVTRVPPGLAFRAMLRVTDDAMLVGDEALLAGMHALMESAHVLVEPAGAAALAGAWERRDELGGKRVVIVLSGANATTGLIEQALATRPLFALEDAAR